jgi:hypothetical protein
MHMSEELKPCPFCGGEAEIIIADTLWQSCYDNRQCFAICTKCKARSQPSFFHADEQGNYYNSKEAYQEAETTWNRRYEPILSSAEVKTIENMTKTNCKEDIS